MKNRLEVGNVSFSPWYINTRRLSDATGAGLSPYAQISVATNNIDRVRAMADAARLARGVVSEGRFQNLATLIAQDSFPGAVVAATWANARFRDAAKAFAASESGRLLRAAVSVQVVVDGVEYWLDGDLEIEHFVSSSAVTYLSGKKQAYFVGSMRLDPGADSGVIAPWLIGDLVENVGVPMSWGNRSQVHPGLIDAFATMNKVKLPSPTRLKKIMANVSEAETKAAFAQILGEPYVANDWGGERSDPFSSRVTIQGEPTSAAFLLKGPGTQGPMYVASLGKRGDQIVRLADEPADLLIVQHYDVITTPVVKTLRQFAIDGERPRRFCVIDGASTYQILKAHGYLDEAGAFVPRPDHENL